MLSFLLPASAYFSGSVINVFIKANGTAIPYEIMIFGRLMFASCISFLSLPLFYPAILNLNYKMYFLRGFMRYCATYCTYYAYSNLPLQIASAIGLTEPLFVALITCLVSNKTTKANSIKWGWIFCGYLSASITLLDLSTNQTLQNPFFSLSIMLLANILASINIIISKSLIEQDGAAIYTAVSSLAAAFFASLIALSNPNSLQNISFHFYELSALGILGLFHSFSFSISLKYFPPHFVSSFQYTKIPFSVILDYLIFSSYPQKYAILGGIGILYSCYKIATSPKLA